MRGMAGAGGKVGERLEGGKNVLVVRSIWRRAVTMACVERTVWMESDERRE